MTAADSSTLRRSRSSIPADDRHAVDEGHGHRAVLVGAPDLGAGLGDRVERRRDRVTEGSRMYLEAGDPNWGEPTSPSAVIGCRVLDIQPVEELLGCPFGPERVKDRVLPVLRDDLMFALGLGAAVPPDDDGQTPLVAQPSPGGIVAPFGHLPDRLPQAAQERPSRAPTRWREFVAFDGSLFSYRRHSASLEDGPCSGATRWSVAASQRRRHDARAPPEALGVVVLGPCDPVRDAGLSKASSSCHLASPVPRSPNVMVTVPCSSVRHLCTARRDRLERRATGWP